MGLKTVSALISLIISSMLVSACSSPGVTNLLAFDQAQKPRPTMQSKQAGLQSTQSIVAERLIASSPDYFVPTIKAVGFSSIAIQPSKNLNQRRLMAMRAAKLDAYRVLAEQIHGVQIDGQTSVAEAMLTSDVLSSAVRGTIMGAETVKIEPTGSDTYIVELSVSQTHLDRLIKIYKQGLL